MTKHKNTFDIGVLTKLYCEDCKTASEIADIYQCGSNVILYWLKKYGIEIRRGGNIKGKPLPKRVNIPKPELVELYVNQKRSADHIADMFGCTDTTVLAKLREAGICVRHHNETKKGITNHLRKEIDHELVASMYVHGGIPTRQIASILGVSESTVAARIREYGFEIRTLSEIWTGKRGGESNPNWNPYLSSEERLTRRDMHNQAVWRGKVYRKDGYTCQRCGDDSGHNLNAHHIESYGTNKGARWDISNGATLCAKCHRLFHGLFGYGNNTTEQFREFMVR